MLSQWSYNECDGVYNHLLLEGPVMWKMFPFDDVIMSKGDLYPQNALAAYITTAMFCLSICGVYAFTFKMQMYALQNQYAWV